MKTISALISSWVIAFAAGNPIAASDIEDLLNPLELSPCNQFEDNTEVVIFYIDMSHEGGEVPLLLPKSYLEDRADHHSGLRHGSVLLRMMSHNALPVSRTQAGRLDATRRTLPNGIDYLTVLVGDFPDLNSAISNLTRSTNNVVQSRQYGLTKLSSDQIDFGGVYTSMNANGMLQTVIECTGLNGGSDMTCTHQTRAQTLDAVIDYPIRLLPNWALIQTRVLDFVACSLSVD